VIVFVVPQAMYLEADELRKSVIRKATPHRSPNLSLDMDADRAGWGPFPARFWLPCHPNTSCGEQEMAMYAVVVRERGPG
jgi:hypothetical protein